VEAEEEEEEEGLGRRGRSRREGQEVGFCARRS
jgi:hypothetical protein